MIRLRADDLSYPAIFFIEHGFAIWKDSRSVFCAGAGLLVDGDLRCYRVMSAESPFFKDGRLLTRDERGRVEYPSETLVCDGDPFFTSWTMCERRLCGW